MASRAISQRITLEGVQEVEAQLKSLGAVGEKALSQLQSDAGTVRGLTQIDQRLTTVTRSAESFGNSLGRLISTLGLTGTSFSTVGQSVGIVSQRLLAHESHTSRIIGKYSLLLGAAAGLGAGLFALGKSAATSADQIEKAAQKAGLSTGAYEKLKFVLQGLGLSESEAEAAIKKFSEGVSQASDKATDALGRLGARFPQTAEGAAAAADVGQRFLNVMGGAASQELDKTTRELAKLALQLDPLTGKWRINEESLVKFADGLTRLHDPTGKLTDNVVRSQAVFSAFGNEIGRVLLPHLLRGGVGVKELIAEFGRLQLGVSEADTALGSRFALSLLKLQSVSSRAKIAIGSIFTPLAIGALDTLTNAISTNRDKLAEWASFIEGKIRSVITDFFKLLNGDDANIDNQWIITIRDGLTTIRDTILNVVLPGIDKLRAGLTLIADGINSVFGTRLTGDQLGIALLIGQFTGLNGAILSVIDLVIKLGTLLVGLAILFGGPAALIATLIAGFAALVVIVAANWETIAADAQRAWDAIKAGASSMWEQIKADAAATVNFIVSLWQRVTDAIRQAGDPSNIPGTAGGGAVPGFARGGHIRGPGTGTSDSILALLSNNEFVLRAKAVRYYGLGFLSRLNALQVPKFNMGGVVENLSASVSRNFAIPRFAGGGLAVGGGGSLHPVTINLSNGTSFEMMGRPSVVSELKREAALAQVRSGGRKPSRYG